MTNTIIIFFIILISSVLISRIFSQKGLKLLNDEEKALLVKAFSVIRIVSVVPPIVIGAGYFIGLKFFQSHLSILIGFFAILLFCYVAGLNIFTYVKVKKAGLPRRFIYYFVLSRVISTSAVILLVVTFVLVDFK